MISFSRLAAMEIISLLCLLTIMYCLTPTSIHSYNNLETSLPISFCPAAVENIECVPNYDVFLNHRGTDVKETIASLIFHNLENKGLKVFLDKNSIQVGDNIPQAIEEAIHSASVHVVILSANYAESVWCLNELQMILKTGAPIIPVFCGVQPSELRMRDEDGVYAKAFKKHKHSGNFEPRGLEEWKKALHKVSYIKGYIFKGDQGELLEQIAMTVAKLIDKTKSQQKQVIVNLSQKNCLLK